MSTKTLLIASVLSAFLLFMSTGLFFADASELLEQAESYQEKGNYEQAEAIYLQIITDYPGTDYALEAQKQLTLIYIATDRQQQADASFGQLVTDFYEHPGISQAVWQIAKGYEQTEEYDKALELHQYNVQQFTPDKHAMWSQTEVVYFNINSGENAAADAAFEKLLTLFSSQPTLPKEIHQIAMKYDSLERYKKALELYQYNVKHSSKDDMYTMWSQVGIVKSHIRDANDAAADEACDKLLSLFSDQESLPKEVYQIADVYSKAERYDKALELHQYNAEHSSKDDMYTMWSQVGIVKSHIRDANDAAADTACDTLLNAFSEQPTLSKEVYLIADLYSKVGKDNKALDLHQYNVEHLSKDDMYTMWSLVEIVKSHIRDANDADADAACDILLAEFSQQPAFPIEVYHIAMKYKKSGREEKAFQIHQYNIEHSSKDDMYTMWSKVEIIKSYICDVNDAGAEEAFDNLLAEFSGQPTLPKEIYQIVDEYARAGEYDKADLLYQHVLDNWPEAEQAGLEHIGVAEINVLSLIESGNDAEAKEALDSLIADFNEHPDLAWTLDGIAGRYEKVQKYDEARSIYQKIVTDYNETDYALTAQKKLAILEITVGDDIAAQAALDILIADFNEHLNLPEAVFVVGEQYYNEVFRYKKEDLDIEAKENFRKAIVVWDRIITDLPPSPTIPEAYNFMAVCYVRLDEYEVAIKYYQMVLDNWPDYQNACYIQFQIGRCYERLKNAGKLTKSETDPLIRTAYEEVVKNYPDCSLVKIAQNWLDYNKKPVEGGSR